MCVGVAGRSPLPQTYCEVKNGWIGAGDARAGVGYSSFDGGLGWEGLVPVGAVTMVTGEPGIGNSLVAMHVAASPRFAKRNTIAAPTRATAWPLPRKTVVFSLSSSPLCFTAVYEPLPADLKNRFYVLSSF